MAPSFRVEQCKHVDAIAAVCTRGDAPTDRRASPFFLQNLDYRRFVFILERTIVHFVSWANAIRVRLEEDVK
jgi:hypothetical protein